RLEWLRREGGENKQDSNRSHAARRGRGLHHPGGAALPSPRPGAGRRPVAAHGPRAPSPSPSGSAASANEERMLKFFKRVFGWRPAGPPPGGESLRSARAG